MISKDTIKTHRRIKSHMAPGIAQTLNKRWMVFSGPDGGWFEISNDVTLDDVNKLWLNEIDKSENDTNLSKTVSVKGSGKNSYKVVFKNNSVSCSCPGFGFRKKCKHIDIAKGKL